MTMHDPEIKYYIKYQDLYLHDDTQVYIAFCKRYQNGKWFPTYEIANAAQQALQPFGLKLVVSKLLIARNETIV